LAYKIIDIEYRIPITHFYDPALLRLGLVIISHCSVLLKPVHTVADLWTGLYSFNTGVSRWSRWNDCNPDF